ncbi:MAG TPA: T9SS type A sorting domain-containing protein [Bacteroidales bacterium]
MKKILLSFLLLSIALTGFSETWTIVNEGFTFSPNNLEIKLGDSVVFDLGVIHNAVEVSQETWEANGNTPLEGGFSVPFGGGLVDPSMLTAGTHYYVCTPHAEGGMKGMIVVQLPAETMTIVNEGFAFSPDSINIPLGYNILFDLGIIHNAVEVSQETWEANGNTPLDGGFAVPFGGGLVTSDMLPEGTHYYVCTPHAEGGMKGMIVVQGPSGILANTLAESISVYPNPSTGNFQVDLSDTQFVNNFTVEIYNSRGQKVFASTQNKQQTSLSLDLSAYPSGIYFVKLFEGNLLYNSKILIQ